MRRLSLRARVAAGVVGMTMLGLLVAGAVTYAALRSFLVDRVDQQLLAAREPVLRTLDESARVGELLGRRVRAARPAARPVVPPGTYGELRAADGRVVQALTIGFDAGGEAPVLPAALPGSGATAAATVFVARSPSGEAYRVRADAFPRGGSLVVALPLADVRQTLRRLLLTELVVSGAVLVGVGALARVLVRAELRPLEDIAATAGAIAAGDLGRRVEHAGGETEVGRLGTALNDMLGQIEHAFRQRQEAEDRLRRFLADASHELRTPLTSIQGYAELFRRGADRRPDDLAKAMARIEGESARMGGLVEDLLLLARLGQGRPLDRSPVDLGEVAADVVADARLRAADRVVAVEVGDGVVVLGDRDRLVQVVANLVGNALVHTPPDAAVTVRARADGAEAVLEVADSGPGMPLETAERAFEAFYRGDASRARTTGGAGLGLAIVAAIAEAHGGGAAVESAPGAGTTVRVRLPLASPPR